MNPLAAGDSKARVLQLNKRRWTPAGGFEDCHDEVTCEQPLEIRLGTFPLAVLMRTPGDDIDLVTGFSLSEGIFKHPGEILQVRHCEAPSVSGELGDISLSENVVRIVPRPGVDIDPQLFQRNLYSSSSCGICGKQSLEQAMRLAPAFGEAQHFSARMLARTPARLREGQRDFPRTGAVHAAALFTQEGEVIHLREDIGRHNAVDKCIGALARDQASSEALGLVVSGRISFEIVQKALYSRISMLVAVGGVSSLAVELARKSGIALVGFARNESLAIYSGASRIQ